MINFYDLVCPRCNEVSNSNISIKEWSDMSLSLECHCPKCNATWTEHFNLIPNESYAGYVFDRTSYNANGEEIN